MNLRKFNGNLRCIPLVINLFDIPTTSIALAQPQQHQLRMQTHLGKHMHLRKCANAFSHVIETINKNNKQIVEAWIKY